MCVCVLTVAKELGKWWIDTEELSEHFVGWTEHKAKVEIIIVVAAGSVRAFIVIEQTIFAKLVIDSSLFLCIDVQGENKIQQSNY